MKIAQIVPNWTPFHAADAIGIKAVARDITLGLIARGHDVTLFAPDRSTFTGVTIQFCGPSLADQGSSIRDSRAPLLQHEYAGCVVKRLSGFDIVHSHIEHDLLPFLADIQIPVVSTIHGANFQEEQMALFQKYPHGTFIALSNRAKSALPYIHFSEVVYNGIDPASCPFVSTPVEAPYVAWMGRFTENKGALDAIDAAKLANIVITLVGFEEKGNHVYLEKIKALEDGANVRLLNKMIGHVKYAFLGNARALLFPIDWEEPFGLVMIEAMACGTPVIAYNRGSVPEIVVDGKTGFIVHDIAGMVEAIKKIDTIDRAACRRHVENNFSVEKMVEGYEKVYLTVSSNTDKMG